MPENYYIEQVPIQRESTAVKKPLLDTGQRKIKVKEDKPAMEIAQQILSNARTQSNGIVSGRFNTDYPLQVEYPELWVMPAAAEIKAAGLVPGMFRFAVGTVTGNEIGKQSANIGQKIDSKLGTHIFTPAFGFIGGLGGYAFGSGFTGNMLSRIPRKYSYGPTNERTYWAEDQTKYNFNQITGRFGKTEYQSPSAREISLQPREIYATRVPEYEHVSRKLEEYLDNIPQVAAAKQKTQSVGIKWLDPQRYRYEEAYADLRDIYTRRFFIEHPGLEEIYYDEVGLPEAWKHPKDSPRVRFQWLDRWKNPREAARRQEEFYGISPLTKWNIKSSIGTEPIKEDLKLGKKLSLNDLSLWKIMLQQSYKDLLAGREPAISIIGKDQTLQGSRFPIPDITKQTLSNSTFPRLKEYHPELSIDDFNKLIDIYYREFPEKVFTGAGLNKEVKGIYIPETKSIAIKPGVNPHSTALHEERHLLDHVIPRNERENTLLTNAYGDIFLNLSNEYPELSGYNMEPEMVTTNIDARDVLLGTKHQWPVHFQNLIIDRLPDEKIIESIERANGYGKRFIESLRNKNQLTPERIAAFREALKYVGAIAPIGLGAATISKEKNGGKVENNNVKIKNK